MYSGTFYVKPLPTQRCKIKIPFITYHQVSALFLEFPFLVDGVLRIRQINCLSVKVRYILTFILHSVLPTKENKMEQHKFYHILSGTHMYFSGTYVWCDPKCLAKGGWVKSYCHNQKPNVQQRKEKEEAKIVGKISSHKKKWSKDVGSTAF